MRDDLTIAELESRMRPGAFSQLGFLGSTESLEQALTDDGRALAGLGLTPEQAALAIERILQAAFEQKKALLKSKERRDLYRDEGERSVLQGYPRRAVQISPDDLPSTNIGYLVEGKFQVFIAQYRGFQECPWDCQNEYSGSYDFAILNRASGEFFGGPGLIVHLIRRHHFFEGLQSPYRVDPARVMRVIYE